MSGNPLSPDILAAAADGIEALREYIRQLESEGERLFQFRAILVGRPESGKSCLIDSLVGRPFDSGKSQTHGVHREQLEFRLPAPERWNQSADTKVECTLMDFGGQEEYRTAQEFFFSRRTVYLVCWKPRHGTMMECVDRVLARIQRLAGEARAIVVRTHANRENHPAADADDATLRRKYPDLIAGFIDVDTCDGTGIDELRKLIPAEACDQNIPVRELLTGFVPIIDPVQGIVIAKEKLDQLATKNDLSDNTERLVQELRQQSQFLVRTLLNVTDPRAAVPRIFTLFPEGDRSLFEQLTLQRLFKLKLRLTLWCEFPGHEHPVVEIGSGKNGDYSIDIERHWWSSFQQYVRFTTELLRTGFSASMLTGHINAESAAALMESLGELANDDDSTTMGEWDEKNLESVGAFRASATAAGFGTFRELLKKADPIERFGGLRRVFDKSSTAYMWLCDCHAAQIPGV
ncbi:MAG: hypothetical protein R3C59_04520 [Planctomycetaceae bacterium]